MTGTELEVIVNQIPGKIECNFDEIEAALRNQMTAYEELEITEDNIPERKADVATLRKIKAAVDDRRKDVKRTFDAPLKEFEGKVRNLTGIIDGQIVRITDALDVFEQKRIAEKQAHNRELYDQNIGEYGEYLPYERIRSDKWNNKTCSDNEIISAIQEMRLKVQSDIAAIKALGSEIEEKLLKTYLETGNNLTAAIQKNADYNEAKKAAEEALKEAAERKAREEAERAARTAEVRSEAEHSAANAALTMQEPVSVWENAVPFEDVPTLTVKVRGAEDIEALRNFLDMSGIQFEEV